jgi:hypothetical protein
MPNAGQILAGLSYIANEWRFVAILWHLYFAAMAALVFTGRASTRWVGPGLTMPLLSVSVLSFVTGNPFNGVVFASLAIGFTVTALRLPDHVLRVIPFSRLIPSFLMFALGWTYPHFLVASSPVAYLYAAPTGLIPCPTLAMVIGISLAVDQLGSRAWSWLLGSAAAFYGVFGVIILRVSMDAILMAGAVLLLAHPPARTRLRFPAVGSHRSEPFE